MTVMLSCRPVRPTDYPPDRLRSWNTVCAQVGFEPAVHEGSLEIECAECGIACLVGPRQQQVLRRPRVLALCTMCAVERAGPDYIATALPRRPE